MEMTASDVSREASDSPEIVTTENKKLMQQITRLRATRTEHERLKTNVMRAIPPTGEFDPISFLADAYNRLLGLDPFADSDLGKELWKEALQAYEGCIHRIESEIGERIRKKLESTVSTEDMLLAFSQVSCLLYRPKIRTAVKSHQKTLFSYLQAQLEDIKSQAPIEVATCGMTYPFSPHFPRQNQTNEREEDEVSRFKMPACRDTGPSMGTTNRSPNIQLPFRAADKTVRRRTGKSWSPAP